MKRKTIITMVMVFLCCMMVTTNVSAAKKKIRSIAFKKYENTLTITKGEQIALKVKFTPSKKVNKNLKFTSTHARPD